MIDYWWWKGYIRPYLLHATRDSYALASCPKGKWDGKGAFRSVEWIAALIKQLCCAMNFASHWYNMYYGTSINCIHGTSKRALYCIALYYYALGNLLSFHRLAPFQINKMSKSKQRSTISRINLMNEKCIKNANINEKCIKNVNISKNLLRPPSDSDNHWRQNKLLERMLQTVPVLLGFLHIVAHSEAGV